VVGEFTVGRGQHVLPSTEVGSRKARTLLAVLAVAGARPVTVDYLTEALWPQAPPRRPAESVATLVSRLRAVLGSDAIAGSRHAYRLGSAVVVDLAEAAALVSEAEARLRAAGPAPALPAARRALDILCRGDLLPDQPAFELAESARLTHDDLLCRARHAVAQAALDTGDVRLARAVAAAGVRHDPLDETMCRTLMRAHCAAGDLGRALAAYERIRSTLAADLGADPSPHTQRLHLEILQDCALRTVADATHAPPVRDRRRAASRRLTRQQVGAIVDSLDALLDLVHRIDPADRAEIYGRLGSAARTEWCA
jgi:DNA-binding SARP family transcriptional activator